jgi:hypothetical protein
MSIFCQNLSFSNVLVVWGTKVQAFVVIPKEFIR